MKQMLQKGFLLAMSILVAVSLSCIYSDDDDDDSGSSGVQEYLEDIGRTLNPLTDATEAWTTLAEEQARVDTTTLSPDQARVMVDELRDAAEHGYLRASEAARAFQETTPPDECIEVHQGTLEAIQLTERAFLEMKGYMERVLRTGSGDDASLNRGNDLLNQADRAKIGLESKLGSCTS